MKIKVTYTRFNTSVPRLVAKVYKVTPFGLPDGILASLFTAKGQLIGASADSTPSIIPAPAADGLSLISDSSQASGWRVGTQSVDVADTTNYLINGGFEIAQRQTPGTDTTITDEKYSADRWRVTRENASLQFSRQDASSESGLTSRYFGRFTKITNAGKFALYQPLEYRDSIPHRGRSLTFQVQMKASGAKTVKIAIVELQAAGTANSLPAAFASSWNVDSTDPTLGANLAVVGSVTSCNVTTSWQNFYVTGTIPADSKNLIVAVWTDADFSAADYLCLAEAGLYRGASTQAWKMILADEIRKCQRYYCKSFSQETAPASAVGVNSGEHNFNAIAAGATPKYTERIYFPVPMFNTPTITTYNPVNANSNIYDVTAAADCSATGSINVTSSGMSIYGTGNASTSVNNRLGIHWTAEAEL